MNILMERQFSFENKPKIFQVFFSCKIESPIVLRSSREGLKFLYNLEKWNILDFLYSITSPN